MDDSLVKLAKLAALQNNPSWGLLEERLVETQQRFLNEIVWGVSGVTGVDEQGRPTVEQRPPTESEVHYRRGLIAGLEMARMLPENAQKWYNDMVSQMKLAQVDTPAADEVSASPVPGKDGENG